MIELGLSYCRTRNNFIIIKFCSSSSCVKISSLKFIFKRIEHMILSYHAEKSVIWEKRSLFKLKTWWEKDDSFVVSQKLLKFVVSQKLLSSSMGVYNLHFTFYNKANNFMLIVSWATKLASLL